jgi:hypothetical protein
VYVTFDRFASALSDNPDDTMIRYVFISNGAEA